jgi:hypothetical protein
MPAILISDVAGTQEYKALTYDKVATPAAKEVVSYRSALWRGYELVKEKGILTTNILVEIQGLIEKNNAGIRKLPGTSLRNSVTGEVVYTPPQTGKEVIEYLSNLEFYINDDSDATDSCLHRKLGEGGFIVMTGV